LYYKVRNVPKIHLTTRENEQVVIDYTSGLSLMQVIAGHGEDDPFALCGGLCSCATCHVYIEAGGEDLPAVDADEQELLEFSSHRAVNSRLSCQIAMSDELDGLRVKVAPAD
jgi:ferredoxin, 2Fe-2S